jgi:2-methylcitrate dehydratase PrpD
MTPSASEKIATFVTGFDATAVTDAARHVVARALYDTLAVAVAGVHEPASRVMQDYTRGQSGPLMASVWATGDRLPVELAALVNGTMAHALDFDDVTSPLRGHPTVAILPALVALAESADYSGRDLIDAYIVGFEVTVKIARAIVNDQYAKGWHSTASIATFGATAACARLLRLGVPEVVNALGIAVSQIAGTRQNFGTMSKPFQAGQANAVALRSVLLARAGFDASRNALDGDQGYTVLYADGQDIHAELNQLGSLPYEIERSGLEVKKYPLCYATHRAIQGVLDLQKERPIQFAEVVGIDLLTNYRATVPLIYPRPQTGLEAKFSMQYAVTAALHDGGVTLRSFEDAAVRRPAIQAFLPNVTTREADPPMFPRWTELTVRLRNGDAITRRVERLRGSAENPLRDAELIEKAADCFAYSGLPVSAEALAAACFNLARTSVHEALGPLIGVLRSEGARVSDGDD